MHFPTRSIHPFAEWRKGLPFLRNPNGHNDLFMIETFVSVAVGPVDVAGAKPLDPSPGTIENESQHLMRVAECVSPRERGERAHSLFPKTINPRTWLQPPARFSSASSTGAAERRAISPIRFETPAIRTEGPLGTAGESTSSPPPCPAPKNGERLKF